MDVAGPHQVVADQTTRAGSLLSARAPNPVSRAVCVAVYLGASGCASSAEPLAASPPHAGSERSGASPKGESPTEPPRPASAWNQLTQREAIFTSDWAKLPCIAPQVPFLLVLDPADAGRQKLAQDAGCETLTETGPDELGLCCPARSGAANPRRSAELASCEQARERYLEAPESETCRTPPSASSGKHGSVLNDGSYLVPCRIPGRSSLSICAAIQDGKAIGVTVRTTPASVRLGDCIARAVRTLTFPASSQMDITHTTFPARHERPPVPEPSSPSGADASR